MLTGTSKIFCAVRRPLPSYSRSIVQNCQSALSDCVEIPSLSLSCHSTPTAWPPVLSVQKLSARFESVGISTLRCLS